ncbi:MAG: single-stranded DNA-binding protein [Lachnospiraceae bacterium]|nr:single-stranded DNA-binding protein [Lachnospiraceae bacterium]
MNKIILMGRLTKDPEVRCVQKENTITYARYTLMVERSRWRDGESNVDYISCVCFGKGAEFADKFLHKGTKIIISGRIQTGCYTNRNNQTVYTADVVVEEQEFAEPKSDSPAQTVPRGLAIASRQTGYIPAPKLIPKQ